MSSSAPRLMLEDEHGYADLRTFVARARSLDAAGAVRLQAAGRVLAAYVGVLPGRGLLGAGEVVGLRTTGLHEDATLDMTVALAALADRLARPAGAPPSLEVPPVSVRAPWAAMTPPRTGWEAVGSLDAATLVEVARTGIAEVAAGVGTGAGAPAVADLRGRVWGRLADSVPPVPSGAAFGAYVLGFLDAGGRCDVYAHGRWTRVSSPHGHVLVR